MRMILTLLSIALGVIVTASSITACEKKVEPWNPETPPHHGQQTEGPVYPKQEGVIRLVTYNVGVFGIYISNSTVMIADMMNEIEADAIAVNEVDYMNDRHRADQLKEFAAALGDWDYMYGKAIPYRNGFFGEGAVMKKELNVLDKYTIALEKGPGVEARVLVVIETEKFIFASTHLDHVSQDACAMQAGVITTKLKDKYGKSGKPVFLCGDLNSRPDSKAIALLKQDWTILSSDELTFPSVNPYARIDYIMLLNNGAKCKKVKSTVPKVFEKGDIKVASDHLPVFVDVIL